MAIGGLIENNASKGQTKVPLLGDIPGLGRLFRSNNISSDKRNLVIFITAKLLSSEGAPIEQIFNFRAIRGLNMPGDELPGYRDGSGPLHQAPTPKADAKAGAKPKPKLEARPGVAYTYSVQAISSAGASTIVSASVIIP
jgi:type II secretory pathway component GspD/PulD (secretin)